MGKVKWIKIVIDVFDDEKIVLIESMPDSDALLVIWFKLLCIAGKTNNAGMIMINDKMPYTEEMLSTIFRRPINTIRLALQTFEKFDMIERFNGVYAISNWEKHQNIEGLEKVRKQARIRQDKYRKKQRLMLPEVTENEDKTNAQNEQNVTCNGDVTLHNGTDIELEIEKEIEEDKKINKDIKDILSFWNNQKIVQHRKLTDTIKGRINSKLRDYGIDEIKQAILNYSFILKSSDYFLDYRWSLVEFLDRTFEKMLIWENAEKSYKRSNVNHKPINPFADALKDMQ